MCLQDVNQPCVRCRNSNLLIFPSNDISPGHLSLMFFSWGFLLISSLLFSSPFSFLSSSQLVSALLRLSSLQLFAFLLCKSQKTAAHRHTSKATLVLGVANSRRLHARQQRWPTVTCKRHVSKYDGATRAAVTPWRSASRKHRKNLWNIISTGADPSGTVSFRNCRAAILPYPSSVLQNVWFCASILSQKYVPCETSCNLH